MHRLGNGLGADRDVSVPTVLLFMIVDWVTGMIKSSSDALRVWGESDSDLNSWVKNSWTVG